MVNGYIKSQGGYDIPYIADLKGNEDVVVIVAHGFASSKESPTVNMLMEVFPKNGIGIAALDFPGHGDSPVGGELLSVENCVNDLRAMTEFVREKCPNAEIGYFGSSFGAYTSLIYLMECDVKGAKVFLRSAAVNMSEYFLELTDDERKALDADGYFVIEEGTPQELKVTAELIEDMKNHDIQKTFVKGDVSIKMIHGSEDEDIDYARAKAFAEKHNIELVTVHGGDHRLSIPGAPEKVLQEALAFFR